MKYNYVMEMSTLRRKRKIEFKSRVNLEDEYFYRVVNPR